VAGVQKKRLVPEALMVAFRGAPEGFGVAAGAGCGVFPPVVGAVVGVAGAVGSGEGLAVAVGGAGEFPPEAAGEASDG
jgi:hypothetical protein